MCKIKKSLSMFLLVVVTSTIVAQSKMVYSPEKLGKWKWYKEDGKEIEEENNLTSSTKN